MKIEFGKIEKTRLIIVSESDDRLEYMTPILLEDGYKYLYKDVKPELNLLKGYKEKYEELEDKIIVHYDIIEYDPEKVRIEIDRLKKLLTDSDYKFLKFQEGLLTAEEYEPTKLERISWRNRINELETHL